MALSRGKNDHEATLEGGGSINGCLNTKLNGFEALHESFCFLTWVLLEHEAQLDGFEAMEVVDRGGGCHDAWDGVEGQERLATKVVAGDDVVIHQRKQDHGALGLTTLQ